MGVRKALLILERRFAWGFFGFLSGALLGVAGLYYSLHEKRAAIAVRVVSQFDILDVRQPLSDLAILFQGEDIQRSNLNLRTLHVRFANQGEADLLQSQYDQSDTWGLRLHGGRILKVQLLDASSRYIHENLSPQLLSDSTVHLDKVILEPGRYYTIDLLVLHPKAVQPELTVMGKIAGSDSIPVRLEPALPPQPSIWSRAFSGPPSAQAVRLVGYFIGAALTIAAVVGSVVGVGTIATERGRRKRRSAIHLVLDTTSPEEVVARDILVHIYTMGGALGLLTARSLIEDRRFLTRHAVGVDWSDFGVVAARHFDHAKKASPGISADDGTNVDDLLFSVTTTAAGDPRSPIFGSDLARRLSRGRLFHRKDGKPQIHPAFHKLLAVAIKRLVPEAESSVPHVGGEIAN